MNATVLDAKVEKIEEEAGLGEGPDSLAKSLAPLLRKEKKEAVRLQRPHLPTGEIKKAEVAVSSETEPSALSSVHRGRRPEEMLPIRPEDVHHEADPVLPVPAPVPEVMNNTKPLKLIPEKKIP